MKARILMIIAAAVVAVAIAVPAAAAPGKPDFAPHIYADGEAWGTKVVGPLPAPNGNNQQSFDKLFIITNGTEGQLPVGEAAPGKGYNGGRWEVWTATWIGNLPHPKPVLMSYADVMFHYDLGHIILMKGSPEGGPPPYFGCPLLPVK
jgi:hypothetical protein